MKKKILCIVFVCVCIFGCTSIGAFADGTGTQRIVEFVDTEGVSAEEASKYIPVEIDSGKNLLINDMTWGATRGVNMPTQAWNFYNGGYGGNFSEVVGGIFTNYYFTGSSKLLIAFDNLSSTGSTKLIWWVRTTDGTNVSGPHYSDTINGTSTQEINKTVSVSSSGKYVVYFKSYNSSQISGRIKVNPNF